MTINYKNISFTTSAPAANLIKHFTIVIYCYSMVMQSFCVNKLYYPSNYRGIVVNYHGICITNVIKHNLT